MIRSLKKESKMAISVTLLKYSKKTSKKTTPTPTMPLRPSPTPTMSLRPTSCEWTKIGNDIDGEDAYDNLASMSLSSDGKMVAIGAEGADGNGLTDSGQVRVYELSSNQWQKVGNGINGEAQSDRSGASVSLSSDGKMVAIGSTSNGDYSGHVRVYKLDESDSSNQWQKVGNDIDGEYVCDESGGSVSLSSDGKTVAIGAIENSGDSISSGHVRVFELSSDRWIKVGNDIDGEADYDRSGYSVSLSSDGKMVAISARYNDGNGNDSGHVRVYKLEESDGSIQWVQVGDAIDGEAEGDSSGESVSLSSDGKIVAIGAKYNDGNGENSGHVRVYKLDESDSSIQWQKVGNDIDGKDIGDMSGESVSLSSDGNMVAIGAMYNDGNGSSSGHVRVYKLRSDQWTQVGNDIDGEANGDGSGEYVSLSSDGKRLAIAAQGNHDNGMYSGHVRVFEWSCSN
jgi:6-phosphogluconolactonase (cycloisomerase 2 family)